MVAGPGQAQDDRPARLPLQWWWLAEALSDPALLISRQPPAIIIGALART
jgi:hypothetical protein